MNQDKPQVMGIDLGGTAIKIGRFLRDGTCLESWQISTPQPSSPGLVVESISQVVNKVKKNHKIVALGIGTPGPTDVTGKIVRVAINLADWQDVPLADLLTSKTGLPTIIANDANCAGLGEAWLGAGKEFNHLILLTLGTGVGGAIILDGKLYTGPQGGAGELGLITLNPEGPVCNSGNNGSLEQYLSIAAIRRATGKEPLELGKLAQAGDLEALEFWQSYGKILGVGLASLIYVLTPEAVIIGGGVSASAEFFLPTTLQEIERRVLAISRVGLQLLKAELGNNAGMVGAAKLAWQLVES
ncbi:ROK family protein [Oscillatoria salina]|uniref:ROK family protein n=1 Tax=Oscillatoria salina TaxID=331517 RepID=UPI0013B5F28B|nr:ROK family protein [Oscillatoria salina]MBZ8179147.1 ROK family protein [Oscillatoria salina IIICB1]NET88068.1 ROK family protein [Kamptonema sp. SIO1D9]